MFAIDEGPRHGIEAWRGPLHVGARLGHKRHTQMELAAQAGADLLVVSAREGIRAALAGLESVGHVARYVVDHAPCDVLLVRGYNRTQ